MTLQAGKLSRGGLYTLLVLAVLLLAIVVCEIIGWPFLRAPAERFVSQQLEREVRLGEPFEIRFFGGLRLQLGNLWISAPPGFDAPHLVDANNISLALRYSDVLNKEATEPLRIKSLDVAKIDARLIRNKDGDATWQFEKDPSKPPTPFPRIENLIVREGYAKVGDALNEADLDVGFASQEGTTNDKPVSQVAVKGKFRGHAVEGKMRTNGLLPIASQGKDTPPIASKGWVEYGGVRVDFDGTVSDLFGNRKINAKFQGKGPSLSLVGDLFNIALPTTTPFKLAGDVHKEDELLAVNINSARIGRSDLTAQFKYDSRPEIPVLSGDLKGKRFVLADLAPAFGVRAEQKSQAEQVKARQGRVIPNRPINLPTLNRFDADIKVDLETVDLGNAFRRPISPFKAHLTLDAGNLSLAKIYARTADGTLSGTIAVDAHNFTEEVASQKKIQPDALPVWRVDLDWKNIDLEKWLQVSQDRKERAKQEGEEVPEAYITGTLNGKTRLKGTGQSTAELVSTLTGDVSTHVRNGSISHLIIEALGLDVAQALGLLIKGDKSLPMQCAIIDLQANQGIVKPDVVIIDTPVTVILADGKISMAKETLDLRLVAKPKNVSPFTVRSPINITGTFANPDVQPEAAPIAARVLGSIALSFVNPLAAILPFIDPGSESETSCKEALQTLRQK
jgi:uncharacterized protein involved in outer membrane biogenesis